MGKPVIYKPIEGMTLQKYSLIYLKKKKQSKQENEAKLSSCDSLRSKSFSGFYTLQQDR